jgi:hypothetical protein
LVGFCSNDLAGEEKNTVHKIARITDIMDFSVCTVKNVERSAVFKVLEKPYALTFEKHRRE